MRLCNTSCRSTRLASLITILLLSPVWNTLARSGFRAACAPVATRGAFQVPRRLQATGRETSTSAARPSRIIAPYREIEDGTAGVGAGVSEGTPVGDPGAG